MAGALVAPIGAGGRSWLALGLLAAAFGLLYGPSYVDLARMVWTSADDAHGPVLLAVAAWTLWKRRAGLAASIGRTGHWAGWPVLGVGLLAYVAGRSLQVPVLEIASQLPVLAGSFLLSGGRAALRLIAFPLLLLLFAVPLPGNLIDVLTGPMKQGVSAAAETLLYAAGYPIARSGVMISVGPYQLLVADACSGLKSVFSLTAIGLLYVLLVRHAGTARNLVLVAATVLFALVANLVRVIALILVTYHFGDEAGQGFIHDFAGIVLFVLAVLLLAAFDWLLSLAPGADRRGRAPRG